MFKKIGLMGIVLCLCLVLVGGVAVQAKADAEFKWNVQSIFPAGSSLYKEFAKFCEKVGVMTGGRLVITPHPVGAIVGYKEMHSALKTGVLQGYYSAPTFQSGKEPAFSIICDHLRADPAVCLSAAGPVSSQHHVWIGCGLPFRGGGVVANQ